MYKTFNNKFILGHILAKLNLFGNDVAVIQHYIMGLYIMGLNSLIFIDTLLKRQRFLQAAPEIGRKKTRSPLNCQKKCRPGPKLPGQARGDMRAM